MRNRSESSQELRKVSDLSVRSYQRVKGCYCVSARANNSGGPRKREAAKKKDAERRDKLRVRSGKGTWSRQDR